ncbi:MAG TPA: hypothetical protein PKH77_00670 [Anaerolineae bacterium]|nr:hypothetical protein [Anaerolineae bacterium]HNT73507.1 hypothetical protein [Anaerolineae bacterium]
MSIYSLPGYTDLSPTEQGRLHAGLSKLVREGSLQLDLPTDREHFLAIQTHPIPANFFFSMMNAELRVEERVMYWVNAENEGLIRIRGYANLVVLLALREELEVQRQQGQMVAGIEIHDLERRCRRRLENLSRSRLVEILNTLKRCKLVTYQDNPRSGDTYITILPFLAIVLSVERMEALRQQPLGGTADESENDE